MPLAVDTALAFARQQRVGALVTRRSDGSPQLSNVVYGVGDDGAVGMSITESRVKTRNLRRDPRASLYVTRPDFWSYVVLEGTVDLSPAARSPEDATVEGLVELYRTVSGDHPDWDDFRRAMVSEGRLLARLRPEHAYGTVRDG